MTDIIFPPTEAENPDQEVIEFQAYVDGKAINCAMPYRLLYERFEAEYSDPLFAFMTCRELLEKLVERRIRDGRFDGEGSILLAEHDFEQT